MKTLLPLALLPLLVACGSDAPTPKHAPEPAANAAPPAARPAAAPKAEPAGKPEATADAKADAPAAGAGDAVAGKVVYDQYCVACHQADGTGMNGMLAGNFVADKERLAKSDEELLNSIANGVTGKIGVMPPWKDSLSEQQRVDVLAHIRATYGG